MTKITYEDWQQEIDSLRSINARFEELTEEQHEMLIYARKSPRKVPYKKIAEFFNKKWNLNVTGRQLNEWYEKYLKK